GGSGLDWNARLGWCAGFGGHACLGWRSGLLLLFGPGVLRWFGPGAFLPLRAGGLLRRGGGGLLHWGRWVGSGVLVGTPAEVLGCRASGAGGVAACAGTSARLAARTAPLPAPSRRATPGAPRRRSNRS